MVQILQAPPRKPKFLEKLAVGVGRGLEAGSRMMKEHQQKQALQGLGDIFNDPNLSEQQRLVEVYKRIGATNPELAKNLGSQLTGLSRAGETPLQKAQRLKLEQEMDQVKGEESYLDRLMRGAREEQPSESPPNTAQGGVKPEDISSPTGKPKQPKVKFDQNDPTTWTDKQINQFRSMEGRTAKAKTLSSMAKNEYERRQEFKKTTKKYKEDIAPFKGALETLEQMQKLGAKGRLGIGTKARGIFSPQTRQDAAEYERLGKSLISFASNIPIRNRQEFETLAHDLYDPNISDDSRAGILAAMRRIIESSMKGFEAPEGEGTNVPQGTTQPHANAPKERPPLTSFMR